MRQFLITKMVCAVCGENLELSYDLPGGFGKHTEGEPTGAAMVEQHIAIKPCKTCMKPLEEIRSAVRVLVGT